MPGLAVSPATPDPQRLMPPLRADLELTIELTTLLRFDSNRRPAWLPAL
jgi:hypothetical protein